ncbi:hypothetical protein [Streptomyces sp. Ru73]|uniref:hypothetical protein n=1 Tax=Streptomyces sp. Ru73 TaxID=2080748 RepID=UPI0015E4277A|nr:hypothetical protein [Streptomyces sp. Ru73]
MRFSIAHHLGAPGRPCAYARAVDGITTAGRHGSRTAARTAHHFGALPESAS